MAKAEQLTAPVRSTAGWVDVRIPDIQSVLDTSDEMSEVGPLLERVREAIEAAAAEGNYYAEVEVDLGPDPTGQCDQAIVASRARVIVESRGYSAQLISFPPKGVDDTGRAGKLTVTWGDGDWRKRDVSGRLRL
jgi:hypothetical protein